MKRNPALDAASGYDCYHGGIGVGYCHIHAELAGLARYGRGKLDRQPCRRDVGARDGLSYRVAHHAKEEDVILRDTPGVFDLLDALPPGAQD